MTREEREKFVRNQIFTETWENAVQVIVDAWQNEIDEEVAEAFQRGVWAAQSTSGAEG